LNYEEAKELRQLLKLRPFNRPKPIILFCDKCGDQTKIVFPVPRPDGSIVNFCVECYHDGYNSE